MTKLVAAACVAVAILAAPRAIPEEQDHRHDGGALGEVNFPVSCSADAQSRFNTTAALLYSFYWERVDSAVAAVLQADPACAMAYWAKAVATLDNPLGSPPAPKQEQEGWRLSKRRNSSAARRRANAITLLPSRPSSKIMRRFHSRRARRPTKRRWSSCTPAIPRTPRRPFYMRTGCRLPRIAAIRPMPSS